ncbi:flavin reductase [Aquabacterium sp. OR-4]|uniref:flavin reductase n=1 Tax=Aquabacterium sp. OR-4 TaxID=2978127 RepID=UPI0028C95165|nr:flavin reductase [Aquabacterium sp. OR-4]MDT7839036.1 flavin reductase [Aquabacterium sp. OR-4]
MNPSSAAAAAAHFSPVSSTAFRDGLARLPGAVTVITTNGPAGAAGFTASAVCSVSDSPPTVLVCMNRSSFAHRFFAGNGVLCINVLSAAQQDLSALFANREVAMDQRFARTPWQACASGAPGLDGALVQLDGRIAATHEVGTHSIFIVELGEVRLADAGASHEGLAYFGRRYHALGASSPATQPA